MVRNEQTKSGKPKNGTSRPKKRSTQKAAAEKIQLQKRTPNTVSYHLVPTKETTYVSMQVSGRTKNHTEKRAKPPEQESAPWGTLLKDFTQETTFHGIRYVTARTRFVLRRLIWILILGGAIALFMFYMVDRVGEYLKFKKNVNVEENYVDKMAFPAVTICNQNPFRLTTAAPNGWYRLAQNITTANEGNSGYPIPYMIDDDEIYDDEMRDCRTDEFRCAVGKQCIPRSLLCDAFPDCGDKSDETTCGQKDRENCSWLKFTVAGGGEEIPRITGTRFHLLKHGYPDHTSMYMTADNETHPLYLYLDSHEQQWIISDKFRDGFVFMRSKGYTTESSPLLAGSEWESYLEDAQNPTSVMLTAECDVYSFKRNVDKTKQLGHDVPLDYLYDVGGQPKGDLLKKCAWKGKECSVETNFNEVMTDLGKCYTFNPKALFVERAGPGFGLTLTLNIEQYEYTRDPSFGVGIMVLLHQKGDIPVMQGRAFAISPGLYTMVAVEKTEVENLEPPWGNCTDEKPKYYDKFTVSGCQMDCENVLARDKCQCLNINMPKVNDGFKYCSVDRYNTCLKEKLKLARQDANFCSCGTPCLEVLYVSSLSFASITTTEDSIKSKQDTESYTMEKNLAHAREMAFRHKEDKYKKTMRVFHITENEFTRMIWTAKALQNVLTIEGHSVKMAIDAVKEDCHWFTSLLYNTAQELHGEVYSETIEFSTIFKANLMSGLALFKNHLNSSINPYTKQESEYLRTRNGTLYFSQYNAEILLDNITLRVDNATVYIDEENRTSFSGVDITLDGGNLSSSLLSVWLPDDQFWNHTSEVWLTLVTVRSAYTTIKSTVDETSASLTHLRHAVENLSDNAYTIHSSRISGLLTLARTKCTWCKTLNRKPLIGYSREKLLTYLTKIQEDFNTIETKLHVIYRDFLLALIQKSNQTLGDILTRRLPSIIDLASSIHSGIQTDMTVHLKEAGDLVLEMLRLITPKCSSELAKYQEEHVDSGERVERNTADIIDITTKDDNQMMSLRTEYESGNKTLQTVAKSVHLHHTVLTITTKISQIQDSLSDRVLAGKRMVNHINALYYWISAQMNDSYLIDKSKYFRLLNITRVETSEPSPGDLLQLHQLVPSDVAKDFWDDKEKDMDKMRKNMGDQLKDLTKAATMGQKYLDDFVKDNQISESFYKKNFLQMDIFYKALTDKKVIQQKAYEYPALLSELGGLMGLLLGGSIISLVEFIDVFLYNGAVKCAERQDRADARRQEEIERNYRTKQQHMEANGFGKSAAGWRSQSPHPSSGSYASHWA